MDMTPGRTAYWAPAARRTRDAAPAPRSPSRLFLSRAREALAAPVRRNGARDATPPRELRESEPFRAPSADALLAGPRQALSGQRVSYARIGPALSTGGAARCRPVTCEGPGLPKRPELEVHCLGRRQGRLSLG